MLESRYPFSIILYRTRLRLDMFRANIYTLVFLLGKRVNTFYQGILMANHKSAVKRVRQNAKRNEINRSNRSKLRTQIKKLRIAVSNTDKPQSTELLNPTVSLIDKAVNKGLIHRNTAARYKSRLTKHVANLA